ncbi:PREDICTED: F-box/LRR-repeat protein At3g58900-like [Fragaria vesca subsp. vesca]|uniref:F-box/LRR-repeat protein At3g58900-like n=1 Tax=Fragaria vesca subsp. vesca TaxID=101020 RepID=UPI0002C3512B|nr:PREDICTED: F-box/LRR-repeat protein At3g58900-like [Fragaria vesca subsp. vesca]
MSYRASHVAQPEEEDVQNLVVAVDRISALPNDLLVSIVSLLNLKEAAATSVLSTRWRHIWTFVTTLDFHHDVLFRLRSFRRVEIESELDRYLNWVNSVVKQHRGSTIKLLRVYAEINNNPKFDSSIYSWVRFALENRVQRFELLIYKDRVLRGANEIKADFITFPHSYQLLNVDIADPVNHLFYKPHNCCISAFSGSKYLRALDFRYVTGLTERVLEFLLSHCPVLERLTVVGHVRLHSFKVTGPSIVLKYLNIHEHSGLASIEICDVNLVSFSYGGEEIKLLLRNVPQLVEVSISSRRLSVGQCDSQLSQLEVFRLSKFVLNNDEHVFPTYVNLKHLELGLKERDHSCLLQLASFMRASPYLHKLVLKLSATISSCYFGDLEIKQAPKHSRQYLRVVEVAGYHGRISDFELVRYLIENAVELEKLVIHPVRGWYSYNSRSIAERKEKKERKQATQQLKELVLPSTFEFICRL